ncbi:MAG: glycosyltransferase, partial [Flammeovirgaceae bacterium]
LLFQPLNLDICHKYIERTVAMTTIGRGIAQEYKNNFPCDPIVINNATWYKNIPQSKVSESIRIIHHGGATVSRHLENMIEMMKYLDNRFTLDLMLVVPELASSQTKKYIAKLKRLAKSDPRISFVPAVKSHEVINRINKYDLGIIIVPSVNFNYANGLPNKLFEFIQAKLAVCVGPIPEIAEIVRNYDIGIVFENFDPKTVATRLSSITKERLIEFKHNTLRAASELTAESNSEVFNRIVDQVLIR